MNSGDLCAYDGYLILFCLAVEVNNSTSSQLGYPRCSYTFFFSPITACLCCPYFSSPPSARDNPTALTNLPCCQPENMFPKLEIAQERDHVIGMSDK